MQDKRYKHIELQKKITQLFSTNRKEVLQVQLRSWVSSYQTILKCRHVTKWNLYSSCWLPINHIMIISAPGLPAIVHANPPKDYEESLMQQSLQSSYDSGERSNLETECNSMRNNSLPVFSRIPDLIIQSQELQILCTCTWVTKTASLRKKSKRQYCSICCKMNFDF
jgi:hypothetical protein